MGGERDARGAEAQGASVRGGRSGGRRPTAGGPAYRLQGSRGTRGRRPHVRVAGSHLPGRTGPSTILVGRDDIPQFRNKAARNGGWNIPSLSGRPHPLSPRTVLAIMAAALVVVVLLVVRCARG